MLPAGVVVMTECCFSSTLKKGTEPWNQNPKGNFIPISHRLAAAAMAHRMSRLHPDHIHPTHRLDNHLPAHQEDSRPRHSLPHHSPHLHLCRRPRLLNPSHLFHHRQGPAKSSTP